MRWFHLAVIILFVAVILIFAIQNLAVVTVAFLGFSARAPLAVLIPIFYLLGALLIRTALSAQDKTGDEGISSSAAAQPENP